MQRDDDRQEEMDRRGEILADRDFEANGDHGRDEWLERMAAISEES